MKSHLKVKVFSLSSEMTYIRKQEEKWKNKARLARQRQEIATSSDIKNRAIISQNYAETNFWSQRHHRSDLKRVARTTHLAYGAMRGVPYSRMEQITYGGIKGFNTSIPDWENIAETVERFSRDEPNKSEIMQRFSEWFTDAKTWFDGNPERIELENAKRTATSLAQRNDPEYQAQRKVASIRAREKATAI